MVNVCFQKILIFSDTWNRNDEFSKNYLIIDIQETYHCSIKDNKTRS